MNDIQPALINYLRVVIEPMIGKPEALELSSAIHSETLLVSIQPAKEDIGRIVGRKGSIIRALTLLVNAAIVKGTYQTVLEIKDPENPRKKHPTY